MATSKKVSLSIAAVSLRSFNVNSPKGGGKRVKHLIVVPKEAMMAISSPLLVLG